MLVLPYKSIQGEHTLKNIKCKIHKVLPENKSIQLVYTGTRLGTKFHERDETKKEHHPDLNYSVKCYIKSCPEPCNSETGRKLIEKVIEHGKNKNSNMFKHSTAANYPIVTSDNFTVQSSGCRNRKFTRKVSEWLCIKHNRP